MIEPRFATMFCFIQTDAAMAQETLDLLTGVCVKRSFDRISVDGQLSTSDTVFALANGGARACRSSPRADDELRFGEALDALLRQLALEIVADGEGARRVGRIVVRGRPDAVEPVARSIANSPLVKTALHGGDPNFGRILQAAGPGLAGGRAVRRRPRDRGPAGGVGRRRDRGRARRRSRELVQGDEVEYALTHARRGRRDRGLLQRPLARTTCAYNAEYTS